MVSLSLSFLQYVYIYIIPYLSKGEAVQWFLFSVSQFDASILVMTSSSTIRAGAAWFQFDPCLNFYSTLSLGTSWNSLGRLWTGSRLFHRGHAHDGRGPFAHPTLSVVATQCFCPGPEYKTPAWHPVASDQLQPIMTNCFAGWRRPVASWATQGSAQAHNIRDRMGLATHCGQCIRHSRSRGRAIGSWECGRGSPVSPWTIRTVIPQLPPATTSYHPLSSQDSNNSMLDAESKNVPYAPCVDLPWATGIGDSGHLWTVWTNECPSPPCWFTDPIQPHAVYFLVAPLYIVFPLHPLEWQTYVWKKRVYIYI